jgi:hypothetical protein
MKVTMKTAEMSIRMPAATKPSSMKMMVPRLAVFPYAPAAQTKANSEAKKLTLFCTAICGTIRYEDDVVL